MHDAILLAPSLILGGILWWTLRDVALKRREDHVSDLDHQRQIDDLLQRIQAPQAAVEEHERRAFARTVREAAPERSPEELEEEQRQTAEMAMVGTVVNGSDDG